ncbi:hypothetical protein IQ235_15645 [Oscillatoriales cyanobacterium LEGE 11467]|uniref:Uncharacterized protein n=1 Tax=Zarconia navalis LEGE 11467 TaxID=1828826 RepID=A0A928W0F5_9CYAN|nr:hypothetical protein [Zarconia navalis]MBE9042212.1 hypothetical protein [Zarconia navalis LEGE 11467]
MRATRPLSTIALHLGAKSITIGCFTFKIVMPPPSPQRIYFEVERVSSASTQPPEKDPLPAWFTIVLAIAMFWVGVQCARTIGRCRSN